MGEPPRILLVLLGGLFRSDVGGIADESAGVKPVIGADGNDHEAEGGKGPHGGEEYLDALFTPHHPFLIPALK